MLNGSCLCGAVAYEADAPLERIVHCHCQTCRKTHGAAFSSLTAVPRERFRWLRGAELLGAFEAQPAVLLRLDCLDTPIARAATGPIWRSDSAPWYHRKAQLPERAEGLA